MPRGRQQIGEGEGEREENRLHAINFFSSDAYGRILLLTDGVIRRYSAYKQDYVHHADLWTSRPPGGEGGGMAERAREGGRLRQEGGTG